MMVNPDQYDPKLKQSHMNCRECVQLPLDVYGIDSSIYTQMMRIRHDFLVHLDTLDYVRKPDIGTFKKDRGGEVFSE